MKTVFTLLAWVACTAACAQSAAPGSVRGRITDSRQEPQVGLVVRLENTAFGTTTDAEGTFFLEKVPAGQYPLVVSGLGYSAQKQALAVPAGQTTRLRLALDKTTTANTRVGIDSFNLMRAQADVAGSLTADKRLYAIAGVGFENEGTFVRGNRHRPTQYFSSVRWEPGVNTNWQINATYNRDRSSCSFAQELPQLADQLFVVPDNFSSSGADPTYRGDSY